MKKIGKNICGAGFLLIIAAAIICSALDLFEGVSILWIIWLCIFGWWTATELLKPSWGALVPASLMVFAFDQTNLVEFSPEVQEVIDKLTPFPLLVSSIIVAIAFNMLFKGKDSGIQVKVDRQYGGDAAEQIAGNVVNLSNSFGESTKYVNAEQFQKAVIKNRFGSSYIYFDNALLSPNGAHIQVKSSFGYTVLYIPATWKLKMSENCTFGEVTQNGEEHSQPESPVVFLEADVSFGALEISRI